MRIRDKTFLLCLDIQCETDVSVVFLDSTGNELPTTREKHQNLDRFYVEMTLPSKIILHIHTLIKDRTTSSFAELQKIMLAGLPVAKQHILSHVVYYADSHVDKSLKIDQIECLPAQKTLSWQLGYVIINFFHPDPFAWHLLIGNKIPFRI